MKNISSKEFITQLEKLKKLYDINILTLKEFTDQKMLQINGLKNCTIQETVADFLIDISILVQQNDINDEELDKIKKIILTEVRNDQTINDIPEYKNEVQKPAINITHEDSVILGNQVWMSRNLNTERYNNGDLIPHVQDTLEWRHISSGAWCYYGKDSELTKKFGKLYNWFAVNDKRGIAPEGWHIPSDAEWAIMINFLRGESVAGGKMKTSTLWYTPNKGATNSCGFSALPGGIRYANGIFDNTGKYGCFWSSSKFNNTNAWARHLCSDYSGVGHGNYDIRDGLSVRCVRDL